MAVELWLRPWASFVPSRRHTLGPGEMRLPNGHDAPVLLHAPGSTPPEVDGKSATAEVIARLRQRSGAQVTDRDLDTVLTLLPFPVRRQPGSRVALAQGHATLVWQEAPERLRGTAEPATEAEHAADRLMLRARAVWDRISDVDDLLADPARLWTALRERWVAQDPTEPRMDVIVRQAREVARVIAALQSRPRRILRRVHRPVPLGRVQEVDRRSMLWLARQPGETLAERAGDDQRILAVAREENYDTLENRVLRAYGDLASRHGRDYLERNATKRQSRRARLVEGYAKTCRRLASDLAARGVRAAEPGVTPNFVLQQNPEYHAIWQAWQDLLREEREKDDLWRWQARSWEEYCSLALMVALAGVPGATPVAIAPIWFRDEHHRGRWIEADSPLGVMFLPGSSLIVELQRGHAGGTTATYAAPLWLRIGRLGDATGFLSRTPVWPIWSPVSGLCRGEAEEVASVVARGRNDLIRGGIVIRPAGSAESSEADHAGDVLALTLGTEGQALSGALVGITAHLVRLFARGTG